MNYAGLIRLGQMRSTAIEGIRHGRQVQQRNRETIADCQCENAELEKLIAENHAAIAELDAAIARIEARDNLPLTEAIAS